MATITSTVAEPRLISEQWHDIIVTKARLPHRRWMPLSVLAGLYIGIGSFTFFTLLSDPNQRTPQHRAVAGIGFSIGLICIVVAGGELYTGSCMVVMAVLAGTVHPLEALKDLSRKWAGNFVGCILFALCVVGMGVLGYPSDPQLTQVGQYFCETAHAKARLNWWEMFFRGILGALLICLAVLMALGSKTPTGKFISIMLPVAVGGIDGMEHCIVSMFLFASATLISCAPSDHGYYWLNLLLSTVGNFVGGAFLATMYYFAHINVDPPKPVPVADESREPVDRPKPSAQLELIEQPTAGELAMLRASVATTPMDVE